jgi:hypothetical protein
MWEQGLSTAIIRYLASLHGHLQANYLHFVILSSKKWVRIIIVKGKDFEVRVLTFID